MNVEFSDTRCITEDSTLEGVRVFAKSNSDNCWNASAASNKDILDPNSRWVGVAFTPIGTDKFFAVGLSSGAGQGFKTIDFAMRLHPGGDLHICEHGKGVSKFGTYRAGSKMEVVVNAEGQVEYRVDGDARYISGKPPSFPLHVQISAHSQGSFLQDVKWITRTIFAHTEIGESEPTQLTLYHGTTYSAAQMIGEQGFIKSAGQRLLGPGVYFSPDIQKAKWYGPMILECSVIIHKMAEIRQRQHAQTWQHQGYGAAHVPRDCQIGGRREELFCISDPDCIKIIHQHEDRDCRTHSCDWYDCRECGPTREERDERRRQLKLR